MQCRLGVVTIAGIYDLVIGELKRRNVQECELYAPYFIVSYACHEFNLHNEKFGVFTENGAIVNSRVHVVYMAPPGAGKSFLLKQLAHPQHGIFFSAGRDMTREQSMTEAGLIGSRRTDPNGGIMELRGCAEEHRESIIVVEEFTDLMTAMKAKNGHNSQLEGQLLSVMDDGHVSKRMASGHITYDTNMTMWCGIQPVKCDLSGGIGRRVSMILNLPDDETKRMYKKAARISNKIFINPKELEVIRHRISLWCSTFKLIHTIDFSDEFLDFIDYELNTEQFIMQFYKRIGLGYHLAKFGVGNGHIVVELNDELRSIIKRDSDWRNRIVQGPQIFQLVDIIQKNGILIENNTIIEKVTLNHHAARSQLTAAQVHDNLLDMVKYGFARVSGTKVMLQQMPNYC